MDLTVKKRIDAVMGVPRRRALQSCAHVELKCAGQLNCIFVNKPITFDMDRQCYAAMARHTYFYTATTTTDCNSLLPRFFSGFPVVNLTVAMRTTTVVPSLVR